MELIKEYPKDEHFTVVWEPKKCIHAGVCVKMLPKVYQPKATPWVNCDHATVDALKLQIDACPSGALSYREGK